MLNQPTSSPMMKTMFGFFAGFAFSSACAETNWCRPSGQQPPSRSGASPFAESRLPAKAFWMGVKPPDAAT